MTEMRLDPLSGRWVVISSARAERPDACVLHAERLEHEPLKPCPFCPGHEESAPPSLTIKGPDGNWKVRVIPNKYPAFEGDEPFVVENRGGMGGNLGVQAMLSAPADGYTIILDAPTAGPSDEELRRAGRATQLRAARKLGRSLRACQRHPSGDDAALGLSVLAMLERAWFFARVAALELDEAALLSAQSDLIEQLLLR